MTEFDGLAVGDQAFDDFARGIRLDLVHQLHGFDDADHLAFFDVVSGRDKRRSARRRRAVVGANDGRLDEYAVPRPDRSRGAAGG